MTYLQRIIQRLSAKLAANMLLPNTDVWSGVIDPFENTQYLTPVFPQSREKRNIKSPIVDQPSPLPPAERLPMADTRQSTVTPQPVSTAKHGEHVNPGTPADIIAPRIKSPAKDSPLTVIQKADTGSEPVTEPDRSSDTGTVGEQQQNDLSPRQAPLAIRWETRWLRRYLGDTAEGVPEQKIHMLSPRQEHLLKVTENVATPSSRMGPRSIPRSTLKQRQTKEPRLVIGQLTVDVVPIKPANTPHRRKRTVRIHAEDRLSKLSRAETARFGFGIGQM